MLVLFVFLVSFCIDITVIPLLYSIFVVESKWGIKCCMSFFEAMRDWAFLVGKAFCWVLFGVGARQFFARGSLALCVWGVSSLRAGRQLFLFGALVLCEGAVVCRGCRSLHVGCQLFAGLTKVIAWGRLSTV